jgi:hypothetical protein
MSITLLLIDDGRPYRERCTASINEMLPTVDRLVEVNDPDHELGFAGAIAEGWRQIATDYVFHVEADFVFNAPVPLAEMVAVLKRRRYLAQLSLKRQAWNEEEKAAGGIVECHPEDFEQVTDHGDIWTEHRRYFTTNPSLYPASLCRQGWPQVENSEGIFTHLLLEDPKMRFGIWGPKFAPPLVEHIGQERAGVGY